MMLNKKLPKFITLVLLVFAAFSVNALSSTKTGKVKFCVYTSKTTEVHGQYEVWAENLGHFYDVIQMEHGGLNCTIAFDRFSISTGTFLQYSIHEKQGTDSVLFNIDYNGHYLKLLKENLREPFSIANLQISPAPALSQSAQLFYPHTYYDDNTVYVIWAPGKDM